MSESQKEHWADSRVDKAIRLRQSGRLEEAVEALREIICDAPDCGSAYLILGSIHWDENRLLEALACFRESVRLLPRLEAASLPLFHVLLELGRTNEAFEEVTRFLSVSESQEYRRLIWELKHGE